jgi:hypothetical protein
MVVLVSSSCRLKAFKREILMTTSNGSAGEATLCPGLGDGAVLRGSLLTSGWNPAGAEITFIDGNYLVSIQKWPFFTISASIGGIPCAVYYLHTSAQSLDFLELAKNSSFLN